MPIAPGATIGPYKVDREIGRGGMGVIFLAQDTRLGRTVALKALPEDVAADPDRLQRFEREARVLASLNHPNIAAIYGLEESEGRRYLALEHIEGETLADRIARGPLPLSETLDVCIQIASGMEAAHDAGVVHRDLKPANVMITSADHVKVLDFGLAKGRVATDDSGLAKSPAMIDSPTTSSPTLAHSPTLISPATLPGVILGTAAYLSPEQARGKIVDRRTDIWSFGCVLFECLTGTRAFEGETVSDTIAKILERPMEWTGLPKSTPPRLRELLERCLEKDPKRRLRDIGDARLTLEEIKSGRYPATSADAAAPVAAASARRRTAALVAAAFLAGALLGGPVWNAATRGGAPSRRPIHLSLALPPNVTPQGGSASPDGSTIVLIGVPLGAKKDADAKPRVYIRHLDQPDFTLVRGTDGAALVLMSRDGRTIEYWAPPGDQTLQLRRFRMAADQSGTPVPVGDVAPDWDNAAAWLESGDMIVSAGDGVRYVRIPANGGAPSAPIDFAKAGLQGRFYPGVALPKDRGVLLRGVWYESGVYRQGIAVLDPKSGKAKILVHEGSSPAYFEGTLLFSRQDALFAVPFDLDKLEVKGEPVGIMSGLRQSRNWINAQFGMLRNGTLIYTAGGNAVRDRHLVIVDRQGNVSDWSPEHQAFEYDMEVSPDGTRAAVSITNADAITEAWVSERGKEASTRIRIRSADCLGKAWAPDSRSLAILLVSQDPSDGIYIVSVDGSTPARRIALNPSRASFLVPTSWSPDGTTILATRVEGNKVNQWAIPVPSKDGELATPRLLPQAEGTHGAGAFSPDGRLVAYSSNEIGKDEVQVRAWRDGALSGAPLTVSGGDGGQAPRWGRDGKQVYYSAQRKLMSVTVTEQPTLSASAPTVAWDLAALHVPPNGAGGALYDLLPDGRFVAVQAGEGEENPTHLSVVLNFATELKARMRAAGK
jgi:Tol biopolymer transport system component